MFIVPTSGWSSASGAASAQPPQWPASERVLNWTVPGPRQCSPTRLKRVDGCPAARRALRAQRDVARHDRCVLRGGRSRQREGKTYEKEESSGHSVRERVAPSPFADKSYDPRLTESLQLSEAVTRVASRAPATPGGTDAPRRPAAGAATRSPCRGTWRASLRATSFVSKPPTSAVQKTYASAPISSTTWTVAGTPSAASSSDSGRSPTDDARPAAAGRLAR